MQTWPKLAVYAAGAVILLLAGAGTCSKYVGTWVPAPNVTPQPGPNPNPKPDPVDVWKPFEAPTSNVIQGVLELPAALEVSSSRRFVPINAKCDNDVRWLISSTQSGAQVEAIECKSTNSVMVCPKPNADDVIVVIAYTAQANKPSAAAITFVKVKADKPPPGPPSPPNPPSPTPTPSPGPT